MSDPKSVFYLLNTNGDSFIDIKKLREIFEKQEEWEGLTGAPGDRSDIEEDVQQADVFLYCGHHGEQK